jgi:hypothetical protein
MATLTRTILIYLGLSLVGLTAQENLADLLEAPGVNMEKADDRARVVLRMQQIETDRRQRARAKAAAVGLPVRTARADGRLIEIHDFDGPQPVYLTTHNDNAAISTGAKLLQTSPYHLNGSAYIIGMWDGGSGRSTHQEFGSRMVGKDGSASIDHATHVGGTLIASGVVADARGMASAATVDSYDWNSDLSEMASRGATAPGQQATRIYLSNHSYGYISGWNYVGTPSRTWEWYGMGTAVNSIEDDFGRYNTYTRDVDALAFGSPYYLIFQSAGNDRADNPSAGQAVSLSPGGLAVVAYNPSTHPGGDGSYRGGFDSMSFNSLAKNVMTVGAVNDAVTNGSRDVSKATMSSFSSWGPTDDGRIKPDLVANGVDVYSSLNGSNTAYGTFSGTSMSTPNACGSASLLIEQYGRLFPGGAMRAATLKGLLIHTADDIGNAGPDYKNGWGLMNAKSAADLLIDHHAYPAKMRLIEGQVTTSATTRSYPFVWDQTTAIRATLCWTDPAGTATNTSDLRTARLVNNLQLKLIAPNGSEHYPFIMPFVGAWTQSSMNSPATTGINNTDNVEQVLVSTPAASGIWQAVVSYSGSLSNSQQNFSLILSGSANESAPQPPIALFSITPNNGLGGSLVTADITGTSLGAGTVVKLARSGQPDIAASSVQLIGESLRCQFNLTGAAPGPWNVVATNPDASSATLANAFTVIGAVWSENFDGTFSGWTSSSASFFNSWTVTTAKSHSTNKSYFAPAPFSKTAIYLTSPSVSIPSNASNLQFKFWHDYNLQSTRDAGRLEFSVNGGAWFEAGTSGTAFSSNGYNATISSSGSPSSRNEFWGRSAWSGNSNGFIETIINLTDTTKFAGKSLRARWCLSTNAGTASAGWYVDSISLVGGGDVSNLPPVITSAATSSSAETLTDVDSTIWRIERGASTTLTVAASDDAGESGLTYTWNASGPAAVAFTPNGTNAAKTSGAEFVSTGDYLVTVTITDAEGLAVAGSVNLRVVQTASGLVVNPAVASLTVFDSKLFSAVLNDQFGTAMVGQPSSFTWNASGGGAIDSSGLFNATSAGGPFAISATSGSFTDFASVTVNPAPAAITLGSLTQTYTGTPRVATATTNPPGLSHAITYEGSAIAPTAVGSYAVAAIITDPNYQGSDNGTLVIEPLDAFAAWQNENFTAQQMLDGLAEALVDAEGDGLCNLAEYALGTDPWEFTPLPPATRDENGLTLIFTRPAGLSGVTYAAESSDGLGVWSPVPLEVIDSANGMDTVRARDTLASGDPDRRFIRLRFTRQ